MPAFRSSKGLKLRAASVPSSALLLSPLPPLAFTSNTHSVALYHLVRIEVHGFWGCQAAVTNCHLHKGNLGTQQINLHFFLAIIIHSQSVEMLLVFHVQIKPWGEDPRIRIVGQYIKQRKQHAVSVLLKCLIITPAPTFTKWDLAWGCILNMHIKANEKINLESQIGQICMLELPHFQVDAQKW